MQFSPAIRPQLLTLIEQLDDGEHGIAEIWRELGHLARARRLLQPSYESVRRIVRDGRERRRLAYSRLRRAAILGTEFAFNTRSRKGIMLDLLDGDDIERRRHEYQRRPRAPAARARPRGAA